jgi:hypothetical protein
MQNAYLTPNRFDVLKIDADVLLFKAACGVVLLSLAWPLALVGYLVTVYGIRILAW